MKNVMNNLTNFLNSWILQISVFFSDISVGNKQFITFLLKDSEVIFFNIQLNSNILKSFFHLADLLPFMVLFLLNLASLFFLFSLLDIKIINKPNVCGL